MNELALFAGAGGGLLATQALGFRCTCAVELNDYCRCLLIKRQNERHFRNPFYVWDDVCTFDGIAWRDRIGIITGGFPCQAFSTAARGRNNARNMWPEMRRIISEVSPKYVFAENVARRAIQQAADDCAAMGYKTEMLSLSAKDLGADHARSRFWLLAYTDNKSELQRTVNAKVALCEQFHEGLWTTFADNSRMVDGLASRMEQYRSTGNGQVSLVAATALWALANA